MADCDFIAKRCTKCGETKNVSEFGNQAHRKDGLNPWCRSCKSISGKDYEVRHKERLKVVRSVYRQANAEVMKPYYAAYYQANREKYDAASAAWAKEHPEQRMVWAMADYHKNKPARLDKQKEWRALNVEGQKLYRKNYRLANLELRAALSRNYKARKKSAEGTHTAEDVSKLMALQKNKCPVCLSSLAKGFHVDHVHPLSQGGSNWPDNLQLLCPACNMKKGSKLPHVFAQESGRLI